MAKTQKPSSKKKAAKHMLSKPQGSPCKCDEGDDGLFYCFKKVQGRWIDCRGPYTTKQECIDKTNERCGNS